MKLFKYITTIKPANKQASFYLVEFDDNSSLNLSIDLITEYKLSSGMEIAEDLLKQVIDKQRFIDCKRKAYSYVAIPRTRKQVVDYLKNNEFNDEEIAKTIVFLHEFNLINDHDFSRKYIINRMLMSRDGEDKIKMLLLQKGIDRDIIEQAIAEHYPHEKKYEMMQIEVKKKLNSIKKRNEKHSKDKIYNYLRNKGFYHSDIKEIISNIFDNMNDE